VPVYVDAAATGFVSEYVTTTGSRQPQLADRLRVFRRPRAPFRDLLPAELQQQVQLIAQVGFGSDPRGSRLMLVRGGVRIYGLPGPFGEACVFVLPEVQMQCWSTLEHGAAPVVDARRDVWGLLGNAARRLDVMVAAGTFRALPDFNPLTPAPSSC